MMVAGAGLKLARIVVRPAAPLAVRGNNKRWCHRGQVSWSSHLGSEIVIPQICYSASKGGVERHYCHSVSGPKIELVISKAKRLRLELIVLALLSLLGLFCSLGSSNFHIGPEGPANLVYASSQYQYP